MSFGSKNCKLKITAKFSTVQLFSTTALICFVILWLCFLLSRGALISQYFFYDTRDTGMDFFHSIEYVRGRAPYEKFNTLYPPLANLMFYVIYRLIPLDVSNAWASTFSEGIAARGTNIDLRTYQAPMLLFILVIIFSVWMIIALTRTTLKNYSDAEANMVALCLLISPGMMFAFERGNILFIIVPLICFFIKFRNSNNRIIRELSLLSLAFAAGLKLYPAFFGLLLLRDKQYKESIRAIIYGVLSVVLPMLFFEEGLPGIIEWLEIIFRFGKGSATPWVGYGFANILHRIAFYSDNLLGIKVQTGWFSYAGYAVAALLLFFSLFSKRTWQSILLITMAIIMYQSQEPHVFCIVCIPMLFFLAEESTLTLHNCVPFILTTVLLVNLPVFYTVERDGTYVSAHNVILKQGVCLLLVGWSIVSQIIAWRNKNEMEK